MTTFVTTHTVLHNATEYPAGTEMTLDENDAEQAATIAHLRAHGAIALAVELQRAEDIQSRLDAKDREVADLQAMKAQLEAELAAARAEAAAAASAPATPAPKAAKTATASVAPASVAPGPVDGSQQPAS